MQKQPESFDSIRNAEPTEAGDRKADGTPDQGQAALVPEIVTTPQPGPDTGDDGSLTAFWETVKRLPAYLRLVNALARDPRIPRRSKGALIVGGAYAVSPIDLVPGVIPVAGQIDDLYVLLTAIQQAIRMAPTDVVDEHLAATGTSRAAINSDLANVRSLVRQGIGWTIRNGGKAVASIGKNLGTFVSKQRQQRQRSG